MLAGVGAAGGGGGTISKARAALVGEELELLREAAAEAKEAQQAMEVHALSCGPPHTPHGTATAFSSLPRIPVSVRFLF